MFGVFALGGDPKTRVPLFFRVSWLGFCPRRPNVGLSVSFGFLLRLFSVGVFVRLSVLVYSRKLLIWSSGYKR